MYQSPRPVFDDLRHRYGPAYFEYEITNEEAFFQLMLLGLSDIGFAGLTTTLEPRTFLDVGCATGRLLVHMRAQGWHVQGVDLTPQSVAYGRRERGLDIFSGTLGQAGFADGSFGVVHFSHLIEHVPDPRKLLNEVYRVVAPGGYAIITTPNVAGLQARLLHARWRSAIADHLYLFEKRTLRRLVRECGFAPKRQVTWGGIAAGMAPTLIKIPLDRLAKRFGFGDVMLLVAQRFE